jgi:hypothetical protein
MYLYASIMADPAEGFHVGMTWRTNILLGGEDGF